METMDAAHVVRSLDVSPLLTVPRNVAAVAPHQPCEWCCAWNVALFPPYANRTTEHRVGLLYPEWIVWHWHVMHHQQGVPLS